MIMKHYMCIAYQLDGRRMMKMSNIFFVADEHYQHHNIIGYTNRPFKDLSTMHNALIRNFNEFVSEDDLTYHLGDFSVTRQVEQEHKLMKILDRLNGRHILIMGNHDYLKAQHYIDIGFQEFHSYLYLEEYKLHLTHDPAVTQVLPDANWLCGHVHGLFKQVGNVINVGVDVWDYKPVSLEVVQSMLMFAEDEYGNML